MGRHKTRICDIGTDDLIAVVTVAEAAKIACVGYTTMYHHITRGTINARQAGRDYLVSVKSLANYYNLDIKDGYLQNSSN